jgi:hypothetical protein
LLATARFHVERIFALHLNANAYNHLVHPERNKELLCSLVEHHIAHPNRGGDVVAGKGNLYSLLFFVPMS